MVPFRSTHPPVSPSLVTDPPDVDPKTGVREDSGTWIPLRELGRPGVKGGSFYFLSDPVKNEIW